MNRKCSDASVTSVSSVDPSELNPGKENVCKVKFLIGLLKMLGSGIDFKITWICTVQKVCTRDF